MATKGNVGLYERYRASWARINGAIEAGYCFEAIAIEESIISNRLTSFLYGVGEVSADEVIGHATRGKSKFLSFQTLIKRWRNRITSDATWEHCLDLINDVDDWRKKRNDALHALAKSFPGKEPDVGTDDFIAVAQQTAKDGARLARGGSKWHKRQLTRAKKVGGLPSHP